MSDQLTDAPLVNGADTEAPPTDAEPLDTLEDTGEAADGEQTADDGPAIEYKGTKHRVPAEVKEAYEAMQAETTRKFQAAAEKERALEAAKTEQAKLDGFRAQFYREIAAVEGINEQLAQFDKVDWARWEREDPDAARNAKFDRIDLRDKRDGLLGQIRSKVDENTAREQQATTAKRTEFESQVKSKVKDWSPQRAQVLEKTAGEYGFSPQEFQGLALVDARVAQVLNDAHMWRQSQKKIGGAPLKVVNVVPKVGGGGATGAKDPDKMTLEEWNKWQDKLEAQSRRAAVKH